MRRLEESAQAEEDKLLRAENTYEADTAKFDTFLKENDRSSVEAIKQAEVQTKIKLDKMGEIKKLQQEIAAAKSSISKQEDLLRELRFYREFVYSLTPKVRDRYFLWLFIHVDVLFYVFLLSISMHSSY